MKKILLILLAILLFGAMTLFGFGAYWWTDDPRPGAYAADPSSQRNTPQGKVVGFDAGFGAHGWLGIPYAAPPDGDLRWRAPRPVRPWSEPLQALQAGAPCPQIGGPLADVARSAYGDVVGDEDCLTLNIYAPYHPPGELEELGISYPVMVWIHGGGNTIGYGADYDGSRLAAKHAVVVVTINYRLGVLGWFNHPAIIGTANDPADASGNFGLLDQIAALRWVQDNIAYFGGNPEQVTVFGESAGGINAFALLASPPARDLFHGVITQSGLARASTVQEAQAFRANGGHPASAREVTSRWLVEQGLAADRGAAAAQQQAMDESELRDFLYGLSPEDLLLGFSAPGGMYRAPALYLDGHVLPARPLLETLADPAAVANVPVISGSNRDEAKLFMAVNGIYVVRHWGVMFEIRDLEVYEGVASLLSDHWRLTGVDQPLDALAAAHPGQQYAYRFDWDESGSGRIADMPTLMGAAHGFELPFVFGDFSDLWGIPLLFPEEHEAGRLELSAAMMDYWSHFAYTGSPDTGRVRQQPPWPGWDVSTGRALRLDTPAGGGIEPLELRLDLADLHERFVGLQERIPEAARCGLYAYLFWKTAEWEPARFEGLEPYCRGKTASDLAADPFGE